MSPRVMSPAAEVAGYLGGVLTLVATLFLVDRPWHDASHGEKALVFALLAVVLIAAGAVVRDRTDSEPARRRLSGLLWLAAVAVSGAAAGALLDDPDGAGIVLPGLVAVVVALPLYVLQRRAAQVVALVLSVAALVAGVLAQNDVGWVGQVVALGLVGTIALAIGVAGRPRPPVAFATVGLFLVVVASVALGFTDSWSDRAGWFGLACCVVAFVAAARGRGAPLDAFAAFGSLVVLERLIDEHAGDDSMVPLAALAAGLVLLVGALVAVRLRGEPAEPPVWTEVEPGDAA